ALGRLARNPARLLVAAHAGRALPVTLAVGIAAALETHLKIRAFDVTGAGGPGLTGLDARALVALATVDATAQETVGVAGARLAVFVRQVGLARGIALGA